MVRNMTIIAMITPTMATDTITMSSSHRMGSPRDLRESAFKDLQFRPGAAKRMAGARRFDDNTILAGTKPAGGPGWLREAIMSDGREHPQSGPSEDRHRWFAAKLFFAIVVTIVAAYLTAKLL